MLKDLVNLNNGFVKVISYAGLSEKRNDGKRNRLWNCECKCGKIIVLTTYQFNNKKPRSCGCYQQQRKGNVLHHEYHTKHGLSKGKKRHPIYRMWKNIKSRCYGKPLEKNKCYRGITMCDEWKNDSVAFANWAFAHGWKPKLCIDRIDPKKGYYPDNCQFLTLSENAKKVSIDNPGLNKGSNHKDAKINEEDVREIRKLLELGYRNFEIAKMKNIKSNVVYQIKKRKTWKHV